jgi:hypothetical protein
MKLNVILPVLAGVVVAGALFASPRVRAESADDRKWIAQCISDNTAERGATMEIVTKYCTCMNNAMDDNETRTITQFEKANPKVRAKCEQASGWK